MLMRLVLEQFNEKWRLRKNVLHVTNFKNKLETNILKITLNVITLLKTLIFFFQYSEI